MTATAKSGTSYSAILNAQDGLARLMGDMALYRQLLRRFRKDYHSTVALMRQALVLGLAADAQRKVHALKGAAGMIGAHELHHLSAITEAAFHTRGLEMQANLELLEDGMCRLLATIDCVLRDTEEQAGTAEAASLCAPGNAGPATRTLIARLAQLLDDGDGAAIDVLEQSASALATGLGVAMYQQVAAAAHEFDFEGALEALQPALQT